MTVKIRTKCKLKNEDVFIINITSSYPKMAHIILNKPVNKFKIQEIIYLTWSTRSIKEAKQYEVTVLPMLLLNGKHFCSTSSISNKLSEFTW